jgi:hypothetical protein
MFCRQQEVAAAARLRTDGRHFLMIKGDDGQFHRADQVKDEIAE